MKALFGPWGFALVFVIIGLATFEGWKNDTAGDVLTEPPAASAPPPPSVAPMAPPPAITTAATQRSAPPPSVSNRVSQAPADSYSSETIRPWNGQTPNARTVGVCPDLPAGQRCAVNVRSSRDLNSSVLTAIDVNSKVYRVEGYEGGEMIQVFLESGEMGYIAANLLTRHPKDAGR